MNLLNNQSRSFLEAGIFGELACRLLTKVRKARWIITLSLSYLTSTSKNIAKRILRKSSSI